jgi:hypothetical protein
LYGVETYLFLNEMLYEAVKIGLTFLNFRNVWWKTEKPAQHNLVERRTVICRWAQALSSLA